MNQSIVTLILYEAFHALRHNYRWMGWNLFLALIPLGLSLILFRRIPLGTSSLTLPPVSLASRLRSPLWWLGLVTFILFLPNAPYILTDIIHFIADIQNQPSIWVNVFVIVPLYLLFILAGFAAYVFSLLNLGYYLKHLGWGRFLPAIELGLHGLSAIGIYLGRFLRFNSWDILTQPKALVVSLDDLVSKRPLLAICITFLLITALYALGKQIALAINAYYQLVRPPAPDLSEQHQLRG